MKKILSMLLLLCSAALFAGAVKTPANASVSIKEAAKDLRKYFQEVYGKPIEKTPFIIYLGDAAKNAKWFKMPSKVEYQQCFMESNGNELVITGDVPGTVWGVSKFMEEYLNVAFLAPDTTIVPSDPAWKMPKVKKTFKPAFMRRAIDMSRPRPYPGDFLRRRATNIRVADDLRMHHGSPHGSHTHAAYIKNWPADAPFGKTVSGRVWKALPCLSDPRTVNLVADKMLEYIAQDRKRINPAEHLIIYDFSQNDGASAFCRCDKCAASAEKHGSDSYLNILFTNKIAEIVGKKYPDVLIQTFAYNQSLPPPKGLKVADNVLVRFCRGGIVSDITSQSQDGKLMTEWSKIAENIAIWSYWKTYAGGGVEMPYTFPRKRMQQELQFYFANNAKFYYGENEGATVRSFYDYQFYLGTLLMFDVNANIEKYTDIFFNGYYGKAAPVMKKYLDYLEKRMLEVPFNSSNTGVFLDKDFFLTVNGYLTEAKKLTANDARSNYHVRRELIPFYRAWLVRQDLLPVPDKTQVIKDLKAIFLEVHQKVADRGWRKASFKSCISNFENECVLYERMPFAAPEQFKGKSYIDLHWTKFHKWGGSSRCKVSDPEAASGAAYECRRDRKHRHRLPFAATLYHAYTKEFPRQTIRLSTVPQDEKYHWYKIGSTPIESDVRITCGPVRTGAIDIHLHQAVSGIIRHPREVWMSVKFTGPAYVKNSKKPNGIFVERVIVLD